MTETPRARATSFEELGALFARLGDPELSKLSVAEFEPRPTDVIITPFGKSGTTWTQQIVHTLRTRGDMDFDDISRVVPWIETSRLLGLDINADQQWLPRVFKSHLSYDKVPKGATYINVIRSPVDDDQVGADEVRYIQYRCRRMVLDEVPSSFDSARGHERFGIVQMAVGFCQRIVCVFELSWQGGQHSVDFGGSRRMESSDDMNHPVVGYQINRRV